MRRSILRSASGSRRSPANARPDNARPESDGVDRTGLTAHYELDGSFSDISGRYQHGRMVAGDPTFDVGQIGRAATFDGDTEVSFGNVGRSIELIRSALRCGCGRAGISRSLASRSWKIRSRRGYEWRFDDFALFDIQRWAGRLTITMASDAPAGAIKVRTRERIKFGEWNHLVMLVRRLGQSRRPADLRERRASAPLTCSRTRSQARYVPTPR